MEGRSSSLSSFSTRLPSQEQMRAHVDGLIRQKLEQNVKKVNAVLQALQLPVLDNVACQETIRATLREDDCSPRVWLERKRLRLLKKLKDIESALIESPPEVIAVNQEQCPEVGEADHLQSEEAPASPCDDEEEVVENGPIRGSSRQKKRGKISSNLCDEVVQRKKRVENVVVEKESMPVSTEITKKRAMDPSIAMAKIETAKSSCAEIHELWESRFQKFDMDLTKIELPDPQEVVKTGGDLFKSPELLAAVLEEYEGQLSGLKKIEKMGALLRWLRLVERACKICGLFERLQEQVRKAKEGAKTTLKNVYDMWLQKAKQLFGHRVLGYSYGNASKLRRLGEFLLKFPAFRYQVSLTTMDEWNVITSLYKNQKIQIDDFWRCNKNPSVVCQKCEQGEGKLWMCHLCQKQFHEQCEYYPPNMLKKWEIPGQQHVLEVDFFCQSCLLASGIPHVAMENRLKEAEDLASFLNVSGCSFSFEPLANVFQLLQVLFEIAKSGSFSGSFQSFCETVSSHCDERVYRKTASECWRWAMWESKEITNIFKKVQNLCQDTISIYTPKDLPLPSFEMQICFVHWNSLTRVDVLRPLPRRGAGPFGADCLSFGDEFFQ